jgi:hypothetical protein
VGKDKKESGARNKESGYKNNVINKKTTGSSTCLGYNKNQLTIVNING